MSESFDDLDLSDDLKITTTRRTAGAGTWVDGKIAGHGFQAPVLPEHAESPDYELGNSRISKLWVQRMADETTVVNFDRGLGRASRYEDRPGDCRLPGRRPSLSTQVSWLTCIGHIDLCGQT